MNKYYIILLIIIASSTLLVCYNDDVNKVVVDNKTGRPMLLGKTELSAFDLSDFNEWHAAEYNGYEADEFVLSQINDLLDSIDIQIFMGTWCGDSRREVPRFIRILDNLNFDNDALTIFNMDRNKHSPDSAEKGKEIEFVPTIIINRNGLEIGRIIEFPIITLESDFLSILLEIQ